jgi:hypothetical protein
MRNSRYSSSKSTNDGEPLFKMDLPKIKPLNQTKGLLILGAVTAIGVIAMGAAIGTQIFFGAIALGGFIAIAESNRWVKWCVIKGSYVVDIAIFAASIIAMGMLGVTISGGLTFAGLLYTLGYAPHVRKQHELNKDQ